VGLGASVNCEAAWLAPRSLAGNRERPASCETSRREGAKPSGSSDLATVRHPPQGTLCSKPLWGASDRRREAVSEPTGSALPLLKGTFPMQFASFSPLVTGQMTNFEAQALTLDDPRPHPHEDALSQLGHALMNEVLDVFSDTALEDFQSIVSETLIGAFHSAGQRIEREADRARDDLNRLSRDFDGSEIADTEMQEATRRARAADVATMAIEFVRDSAAASYTSATGEVWTPWRGSVKASRTTAALIEARDAIRSRKARKHAATDPGATIIAFRASPMADTADDANRIFDALNWAQTQWPDMALATTGAKGAEKLAIKWAKSKNVTLVLAKADFDKHGRAAPFRANDEMLELEPVCVLTLANTLNPQRGEGMKPFGPALNLGQKAAEKGIRHVMIKARA